MREEETDPIVEDFLAHYGAKGMHWGIRKDRESRSERSHRNESQKSFRLAQLPELKTRLGQSLNRKGMTKEQYDKLSTKEVTVSVGKTLRRTTRNPDGTIEDNLFVSRTMKDSQIYRGVMPSSKFLGSYRRPTEGYHEVTMKVVVQLKSPSEKERVDAFVRLMDERSIKTADGKTITGKEWLTESGYGRQAKKLESLELGMMYYQKFTKSNGVRDSPVNSAYFQALKKKGYNAIVDDNDRNIVSKEPWLIIDAKGSLQNLRVKPLSVDDVLKAQKNLVFPEIAHFGTKGMHWGIRREAKRNANAFANEVEARRAFQIREITETEYNTLSSKPIKLGQANSEFKRIASIATANMDLREIAYVSKSSDDHNRYKAVLIPADGHADQKFDLTVKVSNAIVSPSFKVRIDTFIKTMDQDIPNPDGKLVVKGRYWVEGPHETSSLKALNNHELGLKAYQRFATSQMQNTPLHQAYFNNIKAKGYNALIDDADRKVISDLPIILFPKESGARVISVRPILKGELLEARRTIKPLDLLTHFGMKGMHWGIRKDRDLSTETRGERKESAKALKSYMFGVVKSDPRYRSMTKADYEALSTKGETFAKNTTLRRLTMTSEITLKGATFVSKLEEDSLFYRAVLPSIGPQVRGKGGQKEYKNPTYEVELMTVKKLSSPSEKERVDAFLQLLEQPSIKLQGKNAPITGRAYLENQGYKPRFKRYETQELGLKAWGSFVQEQGDRNNPLSVAYFEQLRSKGYNVIPDDNDKGRFTKQPLILLSPESTVKIGTVRRLTTDDINRAQRQLSRKKGGET